MTVIKPNPSIGVLFSCRDDFGGWLTVQVPSASNPGPPGNCGVVVSDSEGADAAILLDQIDRVALARTLRVLSRPDQPTDKAPSSEVEAMAAYAEELENFGYKGCFLSDEVIRMTLAACDTVDAMQQYMEGAYLANQNREEKQ